MALNVYKFVFATDGETGVDGWLNERLPTFTPGDGRLCAHDILEHFPLDDGSTGAEYMALGAMLHVRGEDYYAAIGNRVPLHTHLASDVFRMWQKGFALPKGCKAKLLDKELEQTLGSIAGVVLTNAESELEDYEAEKEGLKVYIANAITWMRKGYLKALVRYKSLDSYILCSLFRGLEAQIDKCLGDAELGQRMTVRLDTVAGTANAILEDMDYEEVA